MTEHEMYPDPELTALVPEFAKVAAMTAMIVENVLEPALRGRVVNSCQHATMKLYDANPYDRPGGVFDLITERTAYLCTQHPERLLCDRPRDRYNLPCAQTHMEMDHAGEVPAICWACSGPIEEMLVTPVFAVIRLHHPVPVDAPTTSRSLTAYMNSITTLPITYLCPRHAPLFKRWEMHWPMAAQDDAA